MKNRTIEKRIARLAVRIAKEIIPANPDGYTYDACEDRMAIIEKDFYLVSLRKYELKYFRPASLWMIYSWLLRNREMIFRKGFYVGGWTFDGFIYLDITVAKHGRVNAESFGRLQGQTAIYYPFEKKEIFLVSKKEAI